MPNKDVAQVAQMKQTALKRYAEYQQNFHDPFYSSDITKGDIMFGLLRRHKVDFQPARMVDVVRNYFKMSAGDAQKFVDVWGDAFNFKFGDLIE